MPLPEAAGSLNCPTQRPSLPRW
jgi:hypothetical protein